ncbi:MAG: LytR C-terminal domain-containing protein [Ignavibacteria bacterium]|nr:LytR C-terminal domain-containing protein [Ignavibacteria bacterium]
MNSEKKSFNNTAINAVIFLLVIVVIYLGYSFIIKITDQNRYNKTEDEMSAPADIVQLEVMNGCGASGVADRVTDYLRQKGCDVVNSGNYKSFDVEKTLVVDRAGNYANALKIAKMLGVAKKETIIRQLNDEYFLDVSVIIGKDYYSLEPFK